jgi:hypothetical protein
MQSSFAAANRLRDTFTSPPTTYNASLSPSSNAGHDDAVEVAEEGRGGEGGEGRVVALEVEEMG